MQLRLSRGAHIALGLQNSDPSPQDVRSAFLQLTKQFHPARFGRLSTETQKLSTEVFLGIKSAHESLLRAVGGVVRGGGRTNQSGAVPMLNNDRDTTRPIATRAVGTQQPAISRTMTPTRHGVGSGAGAHNFGSRAVSPVPAAPLRGVSPVAQRPGTPPGTSPGTPPRTPPQTPPITRPSPPIIAPPAPAATDPATDRGTGEWPPQLKTAPAFDERVELEQVITALATKNWGQAKTLLNSLAARVPSSKQYRALLAYTRGREAQTSGRGEDAVTEFQRALQFDPDLQQAKSAMAELLRRR